MAMTLKEKLYNYFAIRHLDLMPPEVKARFEEFKKNKDYQGQMKQWVEKGLYGADIPDFAPGSPYELTDNEWKELYNSLQKTFQNMNENMDPSVGIKSPYLKTTQDFIKEFFGDDTKTFTVSPATTVAEGVITNLINFLDPRSLGTHNGFDGSSSADQYSAFKTFFETNDSLKDVFSDGLDFDGFLKGLRDKKYNKDLKFRQKLIRIVNYIRSNGPVPGEQAPNQRDWPKGIGYKSHRTPEGVSVVDDTGTPPFVDAFLEDIYKPENNPENDTAPWFALEPTVRDRHIDQLKADWPKIFDTLVTRSKVRSDFIEACDDDVVKKPLSTAMAETDYENKESDNYIPPKFDDEKTWIQELEDLKDDTYEYYLRKFTNPSRGTRIFFSPWSQNIIKAFDKEKIKPTDGLAGIMSKKDAILGRLEGTSPTAKKHFKWFAEKMEQLQKEMPKAFEGALRNGSQMRALVGALIQKAVEDNEIDKAYTALEILSVAKYGLLSSRTLNALNDATKDMKIVGDEKLSWNKNEGIKFVTSAMDKTARLAIMGAGAAFTAAHNAFQHSRTKFNKDISGNKKLNDAYKDKQKEIDDAHQQLRDSNAAHNVAGILADLNSTTRAIGAGSQYKTQMQINAGNAQDIKDAIKAAKDAGNTDVTYNGVTVLVVDLENDMNLYDDAFARQEKDNNWDEKNVNPYRKLIAYWDMLETYTKSHTFTLGSMKVKRDSFLANWNSSNEDDTPAKKRRNQWLLGYNNIRTA